MPEIMAKDSWAGKITKRADVLFCQQQTAVYRRTDRLFGALFVLQWLAGILVAVTISPRAWRGSYSDVHIHVWMAVLLGAAIIARPVYLSYHQPGAAITRHTIAIGQMLYGALLIHLTGGRIETHFHIFGSLAFLSFYRDWRVLISASVVVMLDHILRGIYFPQSIYGVSYIEPWRWLEHTWWVVFEDGFLIRCCLENVKEMRAIATRQAEVEETRDNIEDLVTLRTGELMASEQRLATQYAVTSCLTEATTLGEAAPKIMKSIAAGLLRQNGVVASIMWTVDKQSGKFQRLGQLIFPAKRGNDPILITTHEANSHFDLRLATEVKNSGSLLQLESQDQGIIVTDQCTRLDLELKSAFAFPFIAGDEVRGVIEFHAEETIKLTDAEVSMLESLGQQVGNFAVKMQIEAENLQLANMVEWSGEAIVGQTVDGIITSWNRGAQAFFGQSNEEVKGKHISIICPESKLLELEEFMAIGRAGQTVEWIETQRLTKEGKSIEVSVTRSPVFDDRHRIVGISAVMHNITERKESDRRVSEFYSIVSHELRTPLTSIRGVLGLIEGGVVEAGSAEASELLIVARESTDRLIRLVNDMLDLKKIESGKMVLHCAKLPVLKLVCACLDSLTGMSEAAGVKLCHNLLYKGDVFADPDKATQILTNLVSNAIKFSPQGSEISVTVEPSENGMVRFKIIDNGPGIALCEQIKLFQKFQQLDSSDTRQQGGTGLGLAISKALVEEHLGSIGLESTQGEGSTFWFELPIKQAADVSASQINLQTHLHLEENEELPDKHILLVEDDANLARVLTAHFNHNGYRTAVAGSLKEARDCLGLTHFDVVVLDLGLPDGSGLDLLEEIKSTETTAMLPVIVMTGQTLDDRYMANANVADWLAKPFHVRGRQAQ
jgi:PAS domain S-box-containing protein